MKGRLSPRLTAGLLTLAIWALAAGSALFWGLRLGSGPQRPDAAVAGGPPPGGVTVDTRTVARALAPCIPADSVLHVSGCTKGCAHPKAALTLVGTNDGIDFIRHGTAASTPDRCALSANTVATELQRLLHATPI